MHAQATAHGLQKGLRTASADVEWHKSYFRRKWRARLLRVLLWGTALALAIAILTMLGSQG